MRRSVIGLAMLCWLLGVASLARAGQVVNYTYPPSAPRSTDYQVLVNVQPVFVYGTDVGAFAAFSFAGTVQVEVRPKVDVKWLDIRPRSKGIRWTLRENVIRFTIDRSMNLSLELNGESTRPLYIFANPLPGPRPDPADPNVIYCRAGKQYDLGFVHLKSGQTLYLEGGAVLRGAVLAEHADSVTIRGYGVIDGSLWAHKKTRLLRFNHCHGLRLEGFIVVDSPGWTVVSRNCDGVTIDNIKQVCWRYGSDGIDLVGTSNVVIRNCFLRNNDDNIVIKSWGGDTDRPLSAEPGPEVQNILVEGCTIWNMAWGNALEIGFELRCPAVRNVTFRDIDVIHVERGAVLSIHNGDWATVEDVTYQDIRVEDARHKLIDFAIFLSQYSADRHPDPAERERRYLHGAWDGVQDIRFYGKKKHARYRGHIRHITVRNLRVVDGPLPFSILCGFDDAHAVEDVRIEGLEFCGRKIHDLRQGRFFLEHARGVQLK